jgi:nucleotide-binding universal stress UspA family protein
MLGSAATRIADLVGFLPAVEIRCGDTAHQLLALTAEEPSTLIALGAGGAAMRSRHTIGSTATKIVHSSPGPVLLVPESMRRAF